MTVTDHTTPRNSSCQSVTTKGSNDSPQGEGNVAGIQLYDIDRLKPVVTRNGMSWFDKNLCGCNENDCSPSAGTKPNTWRLMGRNWFSRTVWKWMKMLHAKLWIDLNWVVLSEWSITITIHLDVPSLALYDASKLMTMRLWVIFFTRTCDSRSPCRGSKAWDFRTVCRMTLAVFIFQGSRR